MRYAFDTGFFFALVDQPTDEVRTAWNALRSGTATGVVAGIVLFELRRHALVGRLDAAVVDVYLDTAEEAFDLIWMDTVAAAERIARLAHGNNLSMADATVLHAALEGEASRLYTGDRDLLRLDGFDGLDVIRV